MTIKVSIVGSFVDELGKLPPHRKRAAGAALQKFAREPALPSLRFRVLAGTDDLFIISAGQGDRIILKRIEDDHYSAIDVGPHDNVYRRWNRR